MSSVIVHIGYPKSASTSLQKLVFPFLPEVVNLAHYPTGNVGKERKLQKIGSVPSLQDASIDEWYTYLTRIPSSEYSARVAQEKTQNILQKYQRENKVIVFSSEAFLDRFGPSVEEKVERLHTVLPQAKIFCVTRNQPDMLRSLYDDAPFDPTIKQGKPISFERWVGFFLENESLHSRLRYDQTVAYLHNKFGIGKVLVLTLEGLRENPRMWARSLADFMGVSAGAVEQGITAPPVNTSSTKMLRTVRRAYRWLFRKFPIHTYLPERVTMRIKSVLNQGKSHRTAMSADVRNKIAQSYQSDISALRTVDVLSVVCSDILGSVSEDSWAYRYVSEKRRRLQDDVNRLRPLLVSGARVLDIGAAPFVVPEVLARMGMGVVATDLGPERFPYVQSFALQLRRHDIDKELLSDEDESYNLVILGEVFEHLRGDLIQSLAEMHRVLKPGGVLYLTTPNARSLRGVVRYLVRNTTYSTAQDLYSEWSKIQNYGHMGHVREYTGAEVVKFLRAIGFQSVRIEYHYGIEGRSLKHKVYNMIVSWFPKLRMNMVIYAKK